MSSRASLVTLVLAVSSVTLGAQIVRTPTDTLVCRDVGASQPPPAARGDYFVKDSAGSAFVYFTDARTHRTQRYDSAGSYANTTGMTVQGGWIYVITDGKLHRINSANGKWYPALRDNTGECSFYFGWAGPLYSVGANVFAVGKSTDGLHSYVYRIDFAKRKKTRIAEISPRHIAVPLNRTP